MSMLLLFHGGNTSSNLVGDASKHWRYALKNQNCSSFAREDVCGRRHISSYFPTIQWIFFIPCSEALFCVNGEQREEVATVLTC